MIFAILRKHKAAELAAESISGAVIESAQTCRHKGRGLKFVVSRFNGFIRERLLGGALDALVRTRGQPDDAEV